MGRDYETSDDTCERALVEDRKSKGEKRTQIGSTKSTQMSSKVSRNRERAIIQWQDEYLNALSDFSRSGSIQKDKDRRISIQSRSRHRWPSIQTLRQDDQRLAKCLAHARALERSGPAEQRGKLVDKRHQQRQEQKSEHERARA